MKKIKESKLIYESIKIPENLEYKVNNALRTNKNKSRFLFLFISVAYFCSRSD